MIAVTSVPSVNLDACAQKTAQALLAIYELQTKVVSERRAFTPSQKEIARMHELVFRARLQNQDQCNRWFQQSVEKMVETVAAHFSATHQDSTLINDFLQAADLLKYFIYYSGVFLIDAKESMGLYTKALSSLRELFLQPHLSALVAEVWQLSRQLPLDSSPTRLEQLLGQAKELLGIVEACGWGKATLQRERGGLLSFQQTDTSSTNAFFESQFNTPFQNFIKAHIATVPNKPPFVDLRNHLQRERSILEFLAPKYAAVVMEPIETNALHQVVREVGHDITQMILSGRDQEMAMVVSLFETIDAGRSLPSVNQFSLGRQFKELPKKSTEESKPFKILATMFRELVIANEPKELEEVIAYIAKFEEYLLRVFRNQPDVKEGFLKALEVLANRRQGLPQDILKQAVKESPPPQLALLASMLHGSLFLQEYFNAAGKNSGTDFIRKFRENCQEGSLRWWKAIECERYINQLKVVENQSIVSLTIISQIHFNELKSCVIRCQDLPGRLQALLPKDEKKCLKVLLAHGVGVIEFIGYTLILTSEQLVVLMLAEEEEATKAKLEKLRLIAPAQQLAKTKLLLEDAKKYTVNLEWTAKKKTVSFVK